MLRKTPKATARAVTMYTTDWVMRTDRMLCRPFNSEAIRRYPSGRTTRRPLLIRLSPI